MTRSAYWMAIFSLCFAAASTARADVISGSFSGIATQGTFEVPGPSEVDVTGTVISGSFDVNSVAGAITPSGFPAGFYELPTGSVTIVADITAIGQITTFSTAGSNEDDVLELTDNGTTQQLLLGPGFIDPHLITTITLTGPEGSLFTNIDDPSSIISGGSGGSIVSPLFVSIYAQGSASVDITSFDGVPVDEPAAWSLLIIPVLGIVSWRWNARRRGGAMLRG